MRLPRSLSVCAVVMIAGVQTVQAQAIWQRQAGISNVILYKEVGKLSYYCTWAISEDGIARNIFDAANEQGKLLRFRIRWPTRLTYDVEAGNYIKLIVNGDLWLFYIVDINRESALTDISGEFSVPLSAGKSLQQALESAKTFRFYLPNGVYKELDTAAFPAAIGLLNQCRNEIVDLNARNK
jgi:hypothetical protein